MSATIQVVHGHRWTRNDNGWAPAPSVEEAAGLLVLAGQEPPVWLHPPIVEAVLARAERLGVDWADDPWCHMVIDGIPDTITEWLPDINDPEFLGMVVRHDPNGLGFNAAQQAACPGTALAWLFTPNDDGIWNGSSELGRDGAILAAAAANPNLPASVADQLLTRNDFRSLVAQNPSLNAHTLRSLADIEPAAVVANPACPADVLEALASHSSPLVRRAVAKHPNLPIEALHAMYARELPGGPVLDAVIEQVEGRAGGG